LGVSYKIAGDINNAISSIIKSLRLAYQQQNQYMIYHNYYDASECFMTFGNIGATRKYMNKAANIDYTKFGNRQQVGYIDCQNMLLYHQMLFDNINNIKELDALVEKAYEGNFTWHYCNVSNLRGIIELKEGRFKYATNHFKELLSYCQTYSKSSKQKIYILNNIIASLYFQNKLNEAAQYIDDLIKIIQNEINKIRPHEKARSRIMMSILNLQKNDLQIDDKLIKNFKPELTLIEEEYCIFHHEDMSFYLIYH
jgi:tetratricopeptide (TPR) repeat protein